MCSTKTITHVIFDLDGLLIDTEMWAFNAINLCLEKYEKYCDINFYRGLIGYEPIERSRRIVDGFKLRITGAQMLTEWYDQCLKNTDDIELMPGAVSLVEYFSRHGIPMAIATAGKSAEYGLKTAHLPQIFDSGKFFTHVVHRDDREVKRSKPHPDLFEVCAKRFEPPPKSFANVLVFEDSVPGICAALDAGMQSVFVCDQRFSSDSSCKCDANATIKSLEQFDPQIFNLPPI